MIGAGVGSSLGVLDVSSAWWCNVLGGSTRVMKITELSRHRYRLVRGGMISVDVHRRAWFPSCRTTWNCRQFLFIQRSKHDL